LQSNIALFEGEFTEMIQATNPADTAPLQPIRPIYRPDAGQLSQVNSSYLEPTGDSPLNRDHVVGADD
jgi:hypothetical protein